jgi:hypothetical protein
LAVFVNAQCNTQRDHVTACENRGWQQGINTTHGEEYTTESPRMSSDFQQNLTEFLQKRISTKKPESRAYSSLWVVV